VNNYGTRKALPVLRQEAGFRRFLPEQELHGLQAYGNPQQGKEKRQISRNKRIPPIRWYSFLTEQWGWGSRSADELFENSTPAAYKTYFPISFTDTPIGTIVQFSGTGSSRLVKGYVAKDYFAWRLYNFDTDGITGSDTNSAGCIAVGH
jgi:hypothetical protein